MNAHATPPCLCPTCGAPLQEAPLAALQAACSPAQARILDVIAARPGLTARAIEAAAGSEGLGTQLARIRERIAPFGWTIEARDGRRRGYRLVPASA